jgi:mannose-6-phosphate isomerase-like protein (cupin superfamily)
MQRKTFRSTKGFRVTFGNKGSQAAEMVLPPGDTEGGAKNRHRGSDQWLYVRSGTGTARVNGKRYPLRTGTLMLIEHGDEHGSGTPGMTTSSR